MSTKADTVRALGARLVAVLASQRGLEAGAYPLTLRQLEELTDPHASPELIKQALAKAPFNKSALVLNKNDPNSLVALVEDLERLAGDRRTVESALESLCSPASPLWPLAKVKAAIPNTKLRQPFADAIARQIREKTLPPTVGCRFEKNKPLLYLHRIPPPPPPKEPEELLAAQLLGTLQNQRQKGGDAYPPSLKRLIEIANPGVQPALIKKALTHPILHGKVVLGDAKNQDAPIALVEDRARLISSDLMLTFVLRAKRKVSACACTVESLLAKKSDFYRPFVDATIQLIDNGHLPAGIGWMWIGKKKQIFFLEDVHQGAQRAERESTGPPATSPSQPSARTAPSAEFAPAFDAVFNQIDQQKGGHNFVSLVELRAQLPLFRDVFDAELRKLRVAGRYTLSAAEGRHGISPEERAAGIMENGTLLLYVSRRAP
jgi:hypothetical protein